MVISGNLRKTITIKRLSQVKDQYGATSDTYTDVMTIKAGIKRQYGNLGVNNMEIFNTNVVTFITYFRSILLTDRILYENQLYKISDLTEVGFKENLEITAELINI